MNTNHPDSDPTGPVDASGAAGPVGATGPADATSPAQHPPTANAAAPNAAAPNAAPPSNPSSAPSKVGPRTAPIVWGALILAFCGYAAQRAFGGDSIDTAWWITATVIGLGVLLLVVGGAILLRGKR